MMRVQHLQTQVREKTVIRTVPPGDSVAAWGWKSGWISEREAHILMAPCTPLSRSKVAVTKSRLFQCNTTAPARDAELSSGGHLCIPTLLFLPGDYALLTCHASAPNVTLVLVVFCCSHKETVSVWISLGECDKIHYGFQLVCSWGEEASGF